MGPVFDFNLDFNNTDDPACLQYVCTIETTGIFVIFSNLKSARGGGAEGLQVLSPELRRSLTKLADIDLGTAEDLDVVNPRLIARDELEILRMRQQKKQQQQREAHRGEGASAAQDSPRETL